MITVENYIKYSYQMTKEKIREHEVHKIFEIKNNLIIFVTEIRLD